MSVHPATVAILEHFGYEHLPRHLQAVSREFHDVAHAIVDEYQLEGPEVTAGLRKLLEAKDCMVRAAVSAARVTVPA